VDTGFHAFVKDITGGRILKSCPSWLRGSGLPGEFGKSGEMKKGPEFVRGKQAGREDFDLPCATGKVSENY
jgi:hypothetical protein